MAKHLYRRGASGVICSSTACKPTLLIGCALLLLLLLLPLCTLHSVNLRFPSPSVNHSFLTREPVMCAVTEEPPIIINGSENGAPKLEIIPADTEEQVQIQEIRSFEAGGPITLSLDKKRAPPATEVEAGGTVANIDKLPPVNTSEEERIKWFTENFQSFEILHSDSVSAQFQGKVNTFFTNCTLRFFMTWISSPKSFGPRELLSVESVFKWHPSACLLIISRSMDSEPGRKILGPFVSRGFRVIAAAPDVRILFKGTAAKAWLRNLTAGKTDPGEIPFAQNLSNIIRLTALYMYGGIYIDSDVIILKSMSDLRNVIGAQSSDLRRHHWNRLNNAVLIFDKRQPLVKLFIEEFALNFNGNKWGHNGPYLVTRVLQKLENQNKSRLIQAVMPPMAFYPVDWTRIHSYFQRPRDRRRVKWIKAKLLQMEGESYSLHLWNKQSRHLQVEEGSIIHHIFHKCCIICHEKHFLQITIHNYD